MSEVIYPRKHLDSQLGKGNRLSEIFARPNAEVGQNLGPVCLEECGFYMALPPYGSFCFYAHEHFAGSRAPGFSPKRI